MASADVQSPAAGRRGPAPLLGRERELAVLGGLLAEARAGHGGLALVTGEPGVGKTRLVDAAAVAAGADAVEVVWGWSWEAGAPAYWPWAQVVRTLAGDGLDRLPAALAAIVPGLAARSSADAPPPPPQDRFALFDALAGFLAERAAARPLLVVLDDLHVADEGTLLALEFLAPRLAGMRALVVATLHDLAAPGRPGSAEVLARLARRAASVPLAGLAGDAVARLVEHEAGEAPPELVEHLLVLTGGNAFYLDQVLPLVSADPAAVDPADARLPGGVRAAVERRLADLGPDARELLAAAAVLGNRFRLAPLRAAAALEPGAVLTALDEAVAAGLLTRATGDLGAFAFRHGLVRQTLLAEQGEAERVRRHRRAGQALAEVHAADPEPHLAELAHHFLEAAPGGDAAPGVEYALRAGERALRLLAPEQAVELFERGLAAADLAGSPAAVQARLRHGLGRARSRAGRPRAREVLLDAAACARTAHDPHLLARIVLDVGDFGVPPGLVDHELLGLLEEGLDALPREDDPLRVRLLVRLAVGLYWSPYVERREALVAEALAMARRLGDPATLAYALNHAHLATAGPDTTERSLAWADELFRVTQEAGVDQEVLQARGWRVNLLLELDDVPTADVALRAFEEHARALGSAVAEVRALVDRGRRDLIEGDFAAAESRAREAAARAEAMGDPTPALLARALQFALRWAQGRLDELEPAVRQLADGLPAMPVWRCALALALVEQDRLVEARRELERVAARGLAALPRDSVWLMAMALLAEVCVRLEDRERGREVEALLEPFADRNVVSPQAVFLGPVTRQLGALAALRGDAAAAERCFADARERAERMHARPTTVLVRLDHARALLALGDPGRAAVLAAEARACASELGLDALVARAGGLAPTPEATPAPPPAPAERVAAAPDVGEAALTREGDVWTLRYEGRETRVRDAKGVHHLARLLAHPGVEIHALELVAGEGAARGDAAGAAALGPDVAARPAGADAAPVLDAAAKAAYRERVEALREELEEAERFHDPERAARAREELEFVGRELAGAVGLGGRDRKLGSDAERARVNVTRAIKAVVRRIGEHDRDAARELEATVRTGTFCLHEPDPRRPVRWAVHA